jgi:hypothetical protein
MSATIEELYVKTFTGNMELLLNQGGSILRPLISEQPMTGTGSQIIDQVGKSTTHDNNSSLS